MPVLDGSPTLSYTVGYLVDRTFDLLLAASREEMNRLGAAISSEDTNLAIDFAPKAIKTGGYIAIDDEVMYVWDSTKSSGDSSTAVVQRGMKGTVAADHSAGAIVFVNPYFTRYAVRQTLRDEIRSWGPQVFQIKTMEIPGDCLTRGYDLGGIGPYYFVLDLIESPGLYRRDNDWRSVSYRMVPNAPVSAFPSGEGIIVTSTRRRHGGSYHLTYAAPIDVDTTFNDGDSLLVMGVDNSDIDIAPLGAAWRLASGREVRRMLFEAQGTPADLQNIPPGYQIAAALKYKDERDGRLNDAERRLRAKNPVRRRS